MNIKKAREIATEIPSQAKPLRARLVNLCFQNCSFCMITKTYEPDPLGSLKP